MLIPESSLVGALVVIVFVVIVRGIEEIRAERRWHKGYKERMKLREWEQKMRDRGHL